MKKNKVPPLIVFGRLMVIVSTFFTLSSQSQATAATDYVTFNDGKVYVFPDSCVANVTTTEEIITFTALDGKTFTYLFSQIASVSQSPNKELPTITSFKFNNKYNYQVVTDAIGTIIGNNITAEIIGIGKRLTASFDLSDDNAKVFADGNEIVSKKSRIRYDTTKVFTVGYPNDRILSHDGSGSYRLKPYGQDYTVNVTFLTDLATAVPRIDINTVGGVNISSKEYYLDAQIIIDGKGVFPSMTDSVKVKGRGNTSWSTNPKAKNPYRLKFASKVKPLGLTKGKNWVLLANKLEGSMLTNAYGMKAASLIGTVAANHIIPVDLYVNGTYKGSYNFTEKVGLGNNSVDIDTEDVAALLELDTYYDETAEQKFRSSPYNLPVNIKDPEFGVDETQLTLSAIKQRFNNFLSTVSTGGNLDNHVDLDKLARYMLANEFVCNIELFHPKSTYCYNENILDENSKFIFGPVWDLDWAMGYNGTSGTTYFKNNIKTNYYTVALAQNSFFKTLRYSDNMGRRIYELCRELLGDNLDELCEFCEDYYLYAKPSLEKNKTAAIDATDYADQSARAANWFRQRASFIYKKIRQEQVLLGDLNDDGVVSISDVTEFVDYFIGTNRTFLGDIDADIDNDGTVTIADLTTLIDIIITSH